MIQRKIPSKVTVIVPVYNAELYLERCVNSLIQQTINEVEILLIDDGSTDRSSELCDWMAQQDERIKVFHKENEGQGLARNLGLQMATGKYVCFLDSDDYYELDTCKELYNLMEHTQADLCCYGYQIETQEQRIVRIPHICDAEYTADAFDKKFVLHYFGDEPTEDELRGFSSCMTIFRRDIIEEHKIRFPSERKYLSEDTIFSLRFCEYANKAITTSKIYYHYCQNSESFSQTFHVERLEQTLAFCKVLDEWAKRLGVMEDTQVRRAMYLWVNLMAYLRQGIRHYKGSIKGRKQEYSFIEQTCRRKEIREKLEILWKVPLPKQQKLLLIFILLQKYKCVMWLVRIRANIRL